ncbi:hypothetical protein E1211_09260 [Micromonospora sp. 15K316]|uniref:hypothetical protein n=1 Tax=Micromonospora sp. 15K316 TaxID=2530376 RepID=UPI00104A4D5E|nr:hypothetical protein [Micromonospora sp. 15K316]TDC37778.1 hypothetical protein E1211_09260 [Micromonospora sp. 15K316]
MRIGGETNINQMKAGAVMEFLFLVLFLIVLAVAGATGVTADSRDSADWKPTEAGRRWHSRTC